MSQGYDLMGRLLMCEDRGVRESELFRLAPRLAFSAYIRWPVNLGLSYAENYLTSVADRFLKKESMVIPSGSRRQARNQKNLLNFLKQLRQLVESIPIFTLDFPKGAQENVIDSAQEHGDARGEIIHRILTELHPDSILDINSGDGLIARQAADLAVPVVCFETDHGKVSRLYRETKTKGLPILPLVMDFTKPTPARGLGSHWAIAATERFQCDLVLAVDFLNQPMPRRLGFDKIVNALAQFSKRWVVLELPLD